MPGLQEFIKAHPGLVYGAVGGGVLGIGYLLLKGRGSDSPTFVGTAGPGGLFQFPFTGTTPPGPVQEDGGGNITRHPGPLYDPGDPRQPQGDGCPPGWHRVGGHCQIDEPPVPAPDPRYLGRPPRTPAIEEVAPPVYKSNGPDGGPDFYPPTMGVSRGLFDTTRDFVAADNSMNMSG